MNYKRCNHHKDTCFLDKLIIIFFIICILYHHIMLFIHFWCLKHMLDMFMRSKRKWYLCNMNFSVATKASDIFDGAGFCNVIFRLCYIKICTLSVSVVSTQLDTFLLLKNVGDLVRNFWKRTFASSRASFA